MRSVYLVIAFAAVSSGSIVSQQPQDHPDQEARLRQVSATREAGRTYFDDVDGTLWARGDDFKASFSADGMSFIPFLGARRLATSPSRCESKA